MNVYTVDSCGGKFRLRRSGVPMRANGEFPKCYCCHPNDPLWNEPEAKFITADEAFAAAPKQEDKL